ncbi:MAG TPA: ECF-type sigma factor [Blastocatellia bacterium]|nr:ECF-type sigma factor [Blastocatellia bacterium]
MLNGEKDQDRKNLTLILNRVAGGDKAAVTDLITAVYPVLHQLAAKRLSLERAGHILQPTALVNEVYLKLFGSAPIAWQNRAHFFAVAARQMRFILVDYARKRGGSECITITLEGEDGAEILEVAVDSNQDLIELDEALQQLEEIDPRAARGVEMRFFVGLTQQEIAEVESIDVATVKRDWVFAKSWLYSQLNPS